MTPLDSLAKMLTMTLDMDKMRQEVKEIMELRGLALRDLAAQLESKPSHNTVGNWLNGMSSGVELVADLARWMGKSLREFETWHPAPGARAPHAATPTLLSKLQRLLHEGGVSPHLSKLLVDVVDLEAKERLEKARRRIAGG